MIRWKCTNKCADYKLIVKTIGWLKLAKKGLLEVGFEAFKQGVAILRKDLAVQYGHLRLFAKIGRVATTPE